MVTIVNYGLGNLGSVKNMLKKIGEDSIITSKYEDIAKAEKIILPGVGSFDKAMSNLKELQLIEILQQKVTDDKTPILGICLGMQLLTKGSEEGKLNGFGFIDAYAHKFDFSNIEKQLPTPHMGWNILNIQKDSKIFHDTSLEQRFYFVHSYAIKCNNNEDILATTNYGYEFVSSFEKNNIIGAQFHPEKSHRFGMKFFKNFVEEY